MLSSASIEAGKTERVLGTVGTPDGPTRDVERMERFFQVPEPFELQRLLWDLRHDDALAESAQHDLAGVVATYDLAPEQAAAVVHHDFTALLSMGVSPLLLFFGALRMGVSRPAYYESLRASVPTGSTAAAPGQPSGRR